MTTERGRHPSLDDVENAQRLYEETKDPLFIVLAIGASAFKPPYWAMDAAVELASRAARATRKGNDRLRTGALLDDMIVEFFRLYDQKIPGSDYVPPSVLSVIKTVLARHGTPQDSHEFETERKKLDTAWRREAKGFDDWDLAGVPINARYKRVLRAYGDENSDIKYGQIGENAWKLRLLGIL